MVVVNINDDNVKYEEIKKENIEYKVKAVLYENNNILIGKDEDIIYLPGDIVHLGESLKDGLKRILLNELGVYYENDKLWELILVNYYKKESKNSEIQNSKIVTFYYLGKYKSMNLDRINKLYKNGDKRFDLIDVDEIECDKEMNEVIKTYKKVKR